jgi:hypothetical protein
MEVPADARPGRTGNRTILGYGHRVGPEDNVRPDPAAMVGFPRWYQYIPEYGQRDGRVPSWLGEAEGRARSGHQPKYSIALDPPATANLSPISAPAAKSSKESWYELFIGNPLAAETGMTSTTARALAGTAKPHSNRPATTSRTGPAIARRDGNACAISTPPASGPDSTRDCRPGGPGCQGGGIGWLTARG